MQARFLLFLIFVSQILLCKGFLTPTTEREIRAVWLTTLGGLDWPHCKANNDKNILEQKQELSSILDKLQTAHFNTIFFQTRIRSTVIYPSLIEPWDACLTGQTNKSPQYDPLAYAIEECHKRGLQLHAWVVALPGHNFKTATNLGKYAMQKRVPSLCTRTKDFWMLNPGVPGTADYLADICREIVQNYDSDGIHLDYIRYPEFAARFNDGPTYKKYGGGLSLSEWRRNNVTHIVETIYHTVKSIKPWVWLSCSPIGKYDNLPRQSSRGWNAYSVVFQDAQGWLKQGIMDMLVPMMYFQAGDNFYPFALDWLESSNGRPIVNGLAAYKLDKNEGNWDINVMEKEVRFSRTIHSGGQAYFRCRHIIENQKGIYDFLKQDLYKTPSLPPAITWQNQSAPPSPRNLRFINHTNGYTLTWDSLPSTQDNPVWYNIYSCSQSATDTNNAAQLVSIRQVASTYDIHLNIPLSMLPCYAVTAINRYGIESEATYIYPPTISPAKESYILGDQITLYGNGILILPQSKAHSIRITDLYGQTILTSPYMKTLDLNYLPKGIYTIYGLKKKGRYNILGRYFKNK